MANIIAKCPNNPNHKRFETTAHVMQLWEVDEKGNFINVVDESMEVSHGPDKDNIWTCCECGAEAIIEIE